MYKTWLNGTWSGYNTVPSNNRITHNFYGSANAPNGVARCVKWQVTDAGGKSRVEEQTLNIIDNYGPRFLNQDQNGSRTENIIVNSGSGTVDATVSVPWIKDNLDGYLSTVNYTVQNSSNLTVKSGSFGTGSSSQFGEGTITSLPIENYTIIWTAEDSAGNSNRNSYTTTLSIIDNVAPTLTFTGNYSKTSVNSGLNILDKTITHFIQKPSNVEDQGSGLNANENECTFTHDGNVISNLWDSNGIHSDFEGGFRFGTTTITWKIEDNQGNETEASVDVISDFGWLTESRVNTPVENAPTAYSSSLYNFFDGSGNTVKTFPNRSYGQGSSDSSSPMYPHSSGPLSYVKQGAWTGTLTLKGEWIQFNKFHNNTWWGSDSGSRTNYGRSIRLWSDNRGSETASQLPHTIAVIGSNSNDYGSGTTDSVLLTRISGMVWNDHGSNNSFYGRYYSPSINLGSSREYDYYRIVFEKIHGGSSQASLRNVQLSYIQYVSDNDSDYLTVSGIESDSTRPENIVSNNSQFWAKRMKKYIKIFLKK